MDNTWSIDVLMYFFVSGSYWVYCLLTYVSVSEGSERGTSELPERRRKLAVVSVSSITTLVSLRSISKVCPLRECSK